MEDTPIAESGLPIKRELESSNTLLDRHALLENAKLGPPIPRDGALLSGDREVDLVIEALDKRIVAVEVKLKRTVADDDVRNLRWPQSKVGNELLDAVVITTGENAYRRSDGIGVVPAALLGP
jgi:hypothetical protein